VGAGIFLRHSVQTVSEAHPAPYPVSTGVSFPGVKQPGRETDHLPPFSAEVTNAWSSPTLLNTSGCYFVKNRTRRHGVVLS
jgi:hypothetical protein